METIKLEQQDIEKINKFRDQYAESNTKIGSVSTDEYIISSQLTEIRNTKEEFFNELKTIKQNEEAFIGELREKYGEGQINIQDGTFIANVQPVS